MRDERGFRRTMSVKRPFDCVVRGCEWGKETCKPGSGGSHGRGGMVMHIAVEKDDFALSLYWHLPVFHDDTPLSVAVKTFEMDPDIMRGLGGIDYHTTKRPDWDRDDKFMTKNDCDLLDGGECFSDGSSLRAGALWKEWMALKQPDSDLYELLEDEWEKWYEERG